MRDQTRTDWHSRVDRTVRDLLAHLDRPVELEALAAKAAASPWHFQRMFLALVGESPDDCVRRLRMERAPFLLRRPGSRVLDVAFESGYATPEAFTRAFVRAWGLTPRAVKRLPSWSGSLPSPAGIHYHPGNRERWYFVSPQGGSSVQTKIVTMGPRRLFGLTVLGDPWNLPSAWARLNPLLRSHGLEGSARAWLSTFPPAELSEGEGCFGAAVEVLPLPEGPTCPSDLEEWWLPEGLWAVTVHFGSSEEIGATVDRWEKEWLPSSSWEADPDRPRWEWYQNGHLPPELQITFWCAPVRKRS